MQKHCVEKGAESILGDTNQAVNSTAFQNVVFVRLDKVKRDWKIKLFFWK